MTTNQPTATKALDSAEWIREKQLTKVYGIGRSPAKRLREAKRIRFISLKEPGMTRGTLLYNVESVRAYLAGMEEQAAAELATEGSTVSR